MTTVVRVRQPLTILSMSNQRESRSQSKRLRAQAEYDEQDGDFMFTRAKRHKTAPVKEPPPPPPEPEPAPKSTVKKPRGRPANGKKRVSSPPPPKQQQQDDDDEEVSVTTSKRPTRRKRNSSPPLQEEPVAVPKKRPTRRKRASTEVVAEEQQIQEPVATNRTNGVAATKDDSARRTSGRLSRRKQPAPVAENDVQMTPGAVDTPLEKDPNATKIALPFSDTPINNRNKEFRKKGGAGAGGARRSSITMRGRRASSLIENGQSAIPHKEVDPSEFYKHIEAEVQSEPRRMKQLLTWCGERALSEKPPHGTTAPAVLGARAIQDHLLKDFGVKSEFSDWFSRDDEPSSSARPTRPVVIQPNPINVEHDRKIASLEARIKRLKEQRKSWRALQTPLPQVSPLYPPDADPKKAPLPDASLLDAEEATMLESLTNPSSSFAHLKSTTRSRLQSIQSSVEFKVDNLADSIHKMNLRVMTAGKQADKVLALSSERLKEREVREKEATGTKELPVMEVLRSLGRILPENGG
ncbi:hypothetical protein N0V93_000532 [Gnomoniopsis smithogilvyi]|uniref:Kinetochore protein mis13 n=1 Tax=Gnomoniopsis smithogilvyi TaxID=1191159 RepID=A0A9W8Z1Z6_9PEZI|nr:hypothetical protein N0V93_000532 [Gnomoniopsis smithogilvyi]